MVVNPLPPSDHLRSQKKVPSPEAHGSKIFETGIRFWSDSKIRWASSRNNQPKPLNPCGKLGCLYFIDYRIVTISIYYPSRGRILLSLKRFAPVLDSPFAVDSPGFRR